MINEIVKCCLSNFLIHNDYSKIHLFNIAKTDSEGDKENDRKKSKTPHRNEWISS